MALVCASFALAGSLLACQVPVFRFALERWNPDHYQMLVLSNGKLNADQLGIVETLKRERRHDPVDLKLVNVTESQNYSVMWKKYSNGTDPVVVSMYPESSSTPPNEAAFVTSLSDPHLPHMFQSPVRDQVIQRLANGHSAVWVLLNSGDPEKDQTAFQILKEQIEKDAQWLKLPSPEEMEIKPEILEEAKVKLRIEFSIVEVDRKDPREQFLISCLMNSESDLKDFNEPIAFPVFGRGRVLYALVGAGISPDTIRSASSFIAGPCSCQVKSQNPGFDLLLCHDWDAAVGDKFISQPLPESGARPQLLTIPPGRAAK